MTGGPVRVVIADDHALMVDAVRDRLSASADILVVGCATSAADLLRLLRGARPDVVVLDNRMPDRAGLDCVREIVALHPPTRVLMLSAFGEREDVIAALDAGASGYLDKSVSGAELVRTVIDVGRGGIGFDRRSAEKAITALRAREDRTPDRRLSERELDVLRIVADGGTNGDIAERLSLSVETVKTYIERIFVKLGVGSRTAAVAEAIRFKLID